MTAKKKNTIRRHPSTRTSITPAPSPDAAVVDRPEQPAPEIEPPAGAGVLVELPYAALSEEQARYLGLVPRNGHAALSFVATHVEARLRGARQRSGLRRLQTALDVRGERTADGRRVASAADAVRWVLERYAAACDEAEVR